MILLLACAQNTQVIDEKRLANLSMFASRLEVSRGRICRASEKSEPVKLARITKGPHKVAFLVLPEHYHITSYIILVIFY
jgi:hypothetical protein